MVILTSTFDKIIELSEQIENLYELLYSIEMAEGKDSDNYQKLLKQLKGAIDLETSLYDTLELTQVCVYYGLICNNLADENTDIAAIVTANKDGVIIARVKNNLYKIMMDSNINNFIYLDKLGILPKEIKEAIFAGCEKNEISSFIYNDFLNALLVMLNERIKKEEDTSKKMSFIEQKYRLSFISNKLDEVLFNEDETIYLVAQFLSDKYGLSKEKFQAVKVGVLASTCNIMIKEILETGKLDNSNDFKKLVIETCLLLLDNATITDLNTDFHILADDKEDCEFAEEEIVACFKKVKQNKKTHQIMAFSLKP